MILTPEGRMEAPPSPYVSTVDELREIVAAVQAEGEFTFDVETRGNISRHSAVVDAVEAEWEAKLATLKSTHPATLARSRAAIEDKWTKELALDPLRNEVFWISIATRGQSWAIPMGHPNGEILIPEERGDGSTVPPAGYRAVLASGKESMAKSKYFIPAVFTPAPEQLTQGEVFDVLTPIFMDESIVKINQNVKFDAKSVAKYMGGELPRGLYIDTMVLMHIANENMQSFALGSIIDATFDFDPYWRDGKLGATITTEAFSKACRYAHYDARWAWLTYKRLFRMISRIPTLLSALYVDLPVIRPIAQMELNGIRVNQREMKNLGRDLDMKVNTILADMSPYIWPGFNPDSTRDKGDLLFGKKTPDENGKKGLGLKSKKKTPGRKPSVDAEAMKALKGKHPVVDMLLEYNETVKLKGTFVDGLLPKLNHGRLHPNFNMHRTDTGRLSSNNPNLQNIPSDGKVRRLFQADPGDSLIVADYGQIEMRVFCMFSQDPALHRIFAQGIDIHTGTASVMFGVAPEMVSEHERKLGKIANFLMGYGGTAKRLFHSAGGLITMEQAEEAVEGYNTGYAGMTEWKKDAIRKAKKLGYAETMGGRRRRLPGLNSEDFYDRIRAERQCINAIIQGTASEICKEAMVKVDAILDFPRCKMLVQVHDELIVSVPSSETSIWIPAVEEAMGNGTFINGVELEVEAHSALSWAEAKG